jgi:molybdopterin-guanine dinucleotide biosynthesis protein B
VLVEGYKHANLTKLEVWRAANARPWLFPEDAQFIAVAADQSLPASKPGQPVPDWLDLNDVAVIAAYILSWVRR